MQEIMCTTITQNLLHAGGGGGAGIYIFLVGLAAVFPTLIFCLQVRHEMGILTNKKWKEERLCGFYIRDVFSHDFSKPAFFLERALNKKYKCIKYCEYWKMMFTQRSLEHD